MSDKPVELIVVDSSALIKRAPLHELTNTVYAVDGVIAEIRDENTRASLQVLPYDFKIKEPSSDAYKFIVNFSRKTGDYSNLSVVDLQLLALSYQMCRENLSDDEFKLLKVEPTNTIKAAVAETPAQIKLSKTVNVAGFHLPKKSVKKSEPDTNNNDKNELDETTEEDKEEKKTISKEEEQAELKEKSDNETNNNNDKSKETDHNDDDKNDDDDDDDDDKDNEEDWITPDNLEKIKKMSLVESDRQELNDKHIKVACMTSDFAMQNVLIQIGIPVLSVDGLIIKVSRSYVLRCLSCMKVTTNMEKKFCPTCGYKTLERVVVTVDADGNKVYRGRRKAPTKIGLNFSLPTPRGGKHSNYPILSEDQPQAQNFPSKKSLVKNNPLDPDYVYQASPFATKDVYSRASRLGNNNSDRLNSRFVKRK